MPPVSRWSIRAAAVSFLLGMVLWNVAGMAGWRGDGVLAQALHSPALHLLVVGGLTQMVFGVAWWMFPVRERDRGRGHPAVAWAAFVLLNSGCVARVVGNVFLAYGQLVAGRWLLLWTALALPLAAVCFAVMIAGRLRGPRGRGRG